MVPGSYVTAEPLTSVMSAVAVLGVTRIASPNARPVPVGSATRTTAPFVPAATVVEPYLVIVSDAGAEPTEKVVDVETASVAPIAPSPFASCHTLIT